MIVLTSAREKGACCAGWWSDALIAQAEKVAWFASLRAVLSEGQQIRKKALAKKRIEATRRRSSDWIGPCQTLLSKIPLASTEECERIEQGLAAAPGYLADAHRDTTE